MHVRTLAIAAFSLLLAGSAGLAQTPEIQKQVEKKLGELKKEQAKKDQGSLEELLAQALKNNPDIRVAESKLHEAEAELYRARMKVFNRIVTLQQEIKGLTADLHQARQHYQRMLELQNAGAVPNATVSQEGISVQKATNELARAEAEMDLLVGKHMEIAAKWLAFQPDGRQLWSASAQSSIRIWNLADGKVLSREAIVATPVTGTIADKLRKALDTPVKANVSGVLDSSAMLDFLREHTKGVNIQDNVGEHKGNAAFQLKESVPLGALFEWAEDQFEWRFVIRDYGVVATKRDSVPPVGAVLLLDFWRKGKVTAAP